ASGKGGVGKTTLVANLSAALARFNTSVVAIDGNLTTANLGIHLGIPMYPVTLQDVIKGRARILDAIYYHPAGFRVLPSDISLSKFIEPDTQRFVDVFYKLIGDTDFVLIDSAAGIGRETISTIRAADEVILVTNPDVPSLTDALKVLKMARSYGTQPVGVVVNRVKRKPHEISSDRIQEFLEVPIIGEVWEDMNVPKSIANKQPVVVYNPKSVAAQQFMAIAASLLGREHQIKLPLIHRMFGWLK
ncbi:MAG: septum site-determining protein MinD, partial [Candidatus Aenigmatarchaeota archaeon]